MRARRSCLCREASPEALQGGELSALLQRMLGKTIYGTRSGCRQVTTKRAFRYGRSGYEQRRPFRSKGHRPLPAAAN